MTGGSAEGQGPGPSSADHAASSKRGETRAHILSTAIATIDALGVAGASSSEIARRSGLSWGVIQYHFGSHLGLLQASLDHAVDHYVASLATLTLTGEIEDRCAGLVAVFWAQMSQPTYRASLDVQVHLARQPDVSAYAATTRRSWDATRRAWRSTFPELDRSTVDLAHDLVMPSLRGFAVSQALGSPDARTRRGRNALVDSAVAILRPVGAERPLRRPARSTPPRSLRERGPGSSDPPRR